MNPFAFSGLLIGISSTAMAVWVFFSNPSAKINRLWSIFCVSVAIWGFGGLAFGLTKDSHSALVFCRIAYIGVIFIPGLFYHFVLTFLGLARRKELVVAYILSVGFLITDATPLLMPSMNWMFGQFYYPVSGALSLYFLIFFICVVTLGHLELWRFIRASNDDRKRAQVKLFFAATLIGFTGALNNFSPVFGIQIYPYGNFAVPLYPIIMSYAIIKHQLMDIRVVIKKTLFYSTATVLISFAYIVLVFMLQKFFSREVISRSSLFTTIALILLITIFLKPFEIFLNRLLDKKFFKGSIVEISEQKTKLEEELERRGRLKSVGILAAGMAHEIKNPITAIKTFTEYLPAKYDDPEFREKFIRIVRDETERISAIVKDLLAFSKPSEPNKQSCSLNQILSEITDLLGGDILKKGINLQLVLDQNLPKVCVDPSQTKQALLNILMNAIEAMTGEKRVLRIQTGVVDTHIFTAIEDTGCGMSAETIKHLFDPFFTSKETGTGLGMAITHSLVEKNSGKITVTSRVGKGTRFLLEFPIK